MKIKLNHKKKKKIGHFKDNVFIEDKPLRPMGRLSQLNKIKSRRTFSEAINLWRLSDA